MELVPEKVELHSGQFMQFKSAARTRKIAAMREGKSPSNNTPLPTLLFPKDPALTQPREDRQALPSIPEDTQAENQSQQMRSSPYVQSGSPTQGIDSAADSMLYKVYDTAVPPNPIKKGRLQPMNISILTQIAQEALDADPPAKGTASRPISVEASPELHTNESSVDGGVPVTPRSVDSETAFPISDKLISVISNPLHFEIVVEIHLSIHNGTLSGRAHCLIEPCTRRGSHQGSRRRQQVRLYPWTDTR